MYTPSLPPSSSHSQRFLTDKAGYKSDKSLSCANDAEPACLDWCSASAAQTHCTQCPCKACGFCEAVARLHAVAACIQHDDRDSESLMCLSWCDVSGAKDHCQRCDCGACSFCSEEQRASLA